jgi:hypothetical protein
VFDSLLHCKQKKEEVDFTILKIYLRGEIVLSLQFREYNKDGP